MGDVHTGDGIERVPEKPGRQALLAPDGGEGGSVLRALGSKEEVRRAEARRARGVRRAQKKEDYAKYLQSETWRRIRRAALARDNHACRACGKRAQVVHHIRYPKNLGQEKMEWLYSLCVPCHDEIHRLAANGQTIRAATHLVLGAVVDGKVTRLPDDWRLSKRRTKSRTRKKQKSRRVKGQEAIHTKADRKKRTKLQLINDELHEMQKRARENRERRRQAQ